MMNRIYLILIFCFLYFLSFSQSTALIRVDVQVDQSDAPPESLFARGNHIFLGNWRPEAVRLKKRSSHQWGGIFIMNVGEKIQFLLHDENQKVLGDTFKLDIEKDTLLSINLSTGKELKSVPSQGLIHKLPGTVDVQLVDRMVNVRTPVGYLEDTSSFYPVLYLNDGQFVMGEEEGNVNHWHLLHTLDSLESAGAIDPFITVLIDHEWSNRSMEYADTDLGQRYTEYLCGSLPGHIDRLFRTQEGPQNRYLGGAVAGGFISTLAACRCPEVYGNVIAMSPAYLMHQNDIFETMNSDSLWTKDVNLYMDVGEFGMDEEIKTGCDSMQTSWSEVGAPLEYKQVLNSIPDGENFKWRVIDAILYYFGKREN